MSAFGKTVIWAAVAVFAAYGCGGTLQPGGGLGFSGGMQASAEATRTFESHQVDQGMNYFFTGSDVYPNAIVGIRKHIRLEPADLWKPFSPEGGKLREFVQAIQNRGLSYLQSTMGYAILDGQGRPIGAWYSLSQARTNAFMKDDSTVIVYTPPVDLYDRIEDGDRSHGGLLEK